MADRDVAENLLSPRPAILISALLVMFPIAGVDFIQPRKAFHLYISLISVVGMC